MASLKTKFSVGLFVIIGFLLAIITIIWLGMSHYFEKGNYYAAYFDESVQGLEKDSPVKYRGVSIGRVESVRVAPDANLIEVNLKIETDLKLGEETVAQLKSVGITGIMFVELDRKTPEDEKMYPVINFETKYTLIDTKPSEIKKIMASIYDIRKQLRSVDLIGVTEKTMSILDKINNKIDDARIKEISSEIITILGKTENILNIDKWEKIMASVENASLNLDSLISNSDQTVLDLKKTIKTIDRMIKENEAEIKKTISDFNRFIGSAAVMSEKGTYLIDNTGRRIDQIQRSLKSTLHNMEKTSKSLNRLMEVIADRPSHLIFGAPPPEKLMKP